MHHLHIIVLRAKSAKDAVSRAGSEVSGFGDENNWHCFGGAISKNGKDIGGIEDNARWQVTNLEDLQKETAEITREDEYSKIEYERALALKEDERTSMDWYYIKEYAKGCGARREAQDQSKGKFDFWKHSYRPFEYDEMGITNLEAECGKSKKGKLYAVYLDMHT